LNLERLLSSLTTEVGRLAARYGVIYALLFGSAATGGFKEYSDLDLAVMFEDGSNAALKASTLALDLEEALGVKVDVVPLNEADYVLSFEAFSTGILIHCADRSVFIEDKANAFDRFHDFQPLFERLYRRAVEGIKAAAAGNQG